LSCQLISASNDGRLAVITGGASGIGYAIAERAGAEGMTVVLVDIDAAALEGARATLESRGVAVHAMQADVSDRDAMMALADRVGDEVGETWLLVNNAGVFLAPPFSRCRRSNGTSSSASTCGASSTACRPSCPGWWPATAVTSSTPHRSTAS
jgi:NAD(P)-dependent dehydrogenase (short-subunit alcohol dehydrogenase family)